MISIQNLNDFTRDHVDYDKYSVLVSTPTQGKINEVVVFATINGLCYTPIIYDNELLPIRVKITCWCGNVFKTETYTGMLHECAEGLYIECPECRGPCYVCGLDSHEYVHVHPNVIVLHDNQTFKNTLLKKTNKKYQENKTRRSTKYWEKTISKQLTKIYIGKIENEKIEIEEYDFRSESNDGSISLSYYKYVEI